MPLNNYQLPEGRRIKVFKSGDKYYKGATVTINPMQTKNIDVFIKECAEKVQASWGIRSIHTPNTGTVVNNLEDLQKKGSYVAAGPKGFFSVPGGYENIGKKNPGVTRGQQKILHRPGPKSKVTKIWVFKNGVADTKPVSFGIMKSDLDDWDCTLSKLSDKIQLPNGNVKRLYTLDGKILRRLSDIKDNDSFVATASNESFKDLPYHENLVEPSSNVVHRTGAKPKKTYQRKLNEAKNTSNNSQSNGARTQRRKEPNLHKAGRPKSSKKQPAKKKAPSLAASKINRAKNYYNKKHGSRPSTPKSGSRKFSSNKQSPLFSNHEGQPSTSTTYRSTQEDDDITDEGINTPEEQIEERLERIEEHVKEPEKTTESKKDDLNSSRTSIDYLNVQTDKMVTNHIQDAPLITKTSSGSATSRKKNSHSRPGTTTSITEQDEPAEDVDVGESASRPMSRLSLVDSGHASLLSEDDRPDSIFRAKMKSRPTTTLEVDYDTDDSGMYRAKSRNLYTRGATTVADSTETKIDIPLDLVEAAEVPEEVY